MIHNHKERDMGQMIATFIMGFIIIEVVLDVIAYSVSSRVRCLVNAKVKKIIGTK